MPIIVISYSSYSTDCYTLTWDRKQLHLKNTKENKQDMPVSVFYNDLSILTGTRILTEAHWETKYLPVPQCNGQTFYRRTICGQSAQACLSEIKEWRASQQGNSSALSETRTSFEVPETTTQTKDLAHSIPMNNIQRLRHSKDKGEKKAMSLLSLWVGCTSDLTLCLNCANYFCLFLSSRSNEATMPYTSTKHIQGCQKTMKQATNNEQVKQSDLTC